MLQRATYKQWQSLGAQVAKGEKGSKIVIYKPLPKTEEDDGDRAYYTKALDKIVMPDRELFKGTKTSTETEAYYAVLLHELTHWTGIKSRRDRDMSGRFGEASYAMEELVAELGSAFACAQLGVTNSPRQDHADYIASWINVLEKDPKSVFWASARASEAVAYLDSVQP
nr:zincin-like metallopeptidase domain-containing protein [Marinomonas flavescens]